jgi:hypothetical protein
MEFFEDLLAGVFWAILSALLVALGLTTSMVGVCVSYFGGTKGGSLPVYCGVATLLTAIGLWTIAIFAETPCSMTFAIITSAGAFMSFAYWLARYDRK